MATAMPQFPDAQQLMAQYNAAQQMMSVGNVLQFTPPGFNQPLRVKFPDYRLPVCEKCKKNYKTRDMCRVRNGHTDLPWSPVYICITLDASCTDENGKYVQGPFAVRPQQWQPYCIKKEKVAGYFDSKTPICAACKKKNYTRSFCRERHKHRSLPWSTVYVVLSSLGGESSEAAQTSSDAGDEDKSSNLGATVASIIDPAEAALPGSGSDDINDVENNPSRTFLVKVSAKGCTIQWVEMDESELHAFGVAATGGHHHSHHSSVAGMNMGMGMNMNPMGMNMGMNMNPMNKYGQGNGMYGGANANNMFYNAAAANLAYPYMGAAFNNMMGMNMMGMNAAASASASAASPLNMMNMPSIAGTSSTATANVNVNVNPTPMQMAQFPGMNGNSNTNSTEGNANSNGNTKEGNVNANSNTEEGTENKDAATAQYQQYMNWQAAHAQMWYHQQAMMAANTGATDDNADADNAVQEVQEGIVDDNGAVHAVPENAQEDKEEHDVHEEKHSTIEAANIAVDPVPIKADEEHGHEHVNGLEEEDALEAAVPETAAVQEEEHVHVTTVVHDDQHQHEHEHEHDVVDVHNAFDEALGDVNVDSLTEDGERVGKRTKRV